MNINIKFYTDGKFEMQLELLLCENLKSKKPASAQLHNK